MLISVIILNYNGEHLLPDCIESLKNQTCKSIEIIVADNGSNDGSKNVCLEYGVYFFEMRVNKGFGKTNNEAAKIAKGDFIFFVNNDMRFEQDCIKELVMPLLEDETIFATDALQYNWDGDNIIHAETKLKKGTLKHWFPFMEVNFCNITNKKVDVPWGCAGSFMVRKKMFEELGGFDDTFFLDIEDIDLCCRAWMRGWRTVYVPTARLYHKVGGSTGVHTVPEWRQLSSEKNLQRFVLKTMSKKGILNFFPAKFLQAIGLCIKGKFKASKLIFKAMKLNLFEIKDIMRERGKIRGNSKISSDMLLDYFMLK